MRGEEVALGEGGQVGSPAIVRPQLGLDGPLAEAVIAPLRYAALVPRTAIVAGVPCRGISLIRETTQCLMEVRAAIRRARPAEQGTEHEERDQDYGRQSPHREGLT